MIVSKGVVVGSLNNSQSPTGSLINTNDVTGVVGSKETITGVVNTSSMFIMSDEIDPTVPDHVKTISEEDIEKWNSVNNYDDTELREIINNKPDTNDIPTNVSELNNDSGYITEIPKEYITEDELNSKNYLTKHQDISHLATKEEIPTIPTNVSAFNNDKGYLTKHQDISHLATKVYVDDTIVEAIRNVKTTDFKTAEVLPTENISTNTIYLISKEAAENNIYEEYIYVNNSWEKIGETDVDLSQYYTKEDIDDKGYLTNHQDISHLATKEELPTVPTNISAFNNDKGYLTSFEETDPLFKASPSANITNNDIDNWNNKSEFSGSYNDLDDKPTIPTVPDHVKSITETEISKWNSMRNIYTSTSSPSDSDGVNGDIWIIYEE